jgi:hypothetical protein
MVDVLLIEDFNDYSDITRYSIQMYGNIKRTLIDQLKSMHTKYFDDNNDPLIWISPVNINLSVKFEAMLKFLLDQN